MQIHVKVNGMDYTMKLNQGYCWYIISVMYSGLRVHISDAKQVFVVHAQFM